ncbi:MAG: hypothetical protein NTU91_05150 [Chloroflexi bacterium]|nr:hypothetical protein [Chloroflexota bacterium]
MADCQGDSGLRGFRRLHTGVRGVLVADLFFHLDAVDIRCIDGLCVVGAGLVTALQLNVVSIGAGGL